jgi:hypothetical protein
LPDFTDESENYRKSSINIPHQKENKMRKKTLLAGIIVGALFFTTAAFASVNDDQVTSQKIREADGTSGQNTNSGSGVKTNHIQDGAVTASKITGPIGVEKLSSYAGVKIVHAGAANGITTFNSLRDALNSIEAEQTTNNYAVLVMPGTYSEDLNSGLNWSGRNTATIIGQGRESTILVGGDAYRQIFMKSNLFFSNLTLQGSVLILNGVHDVSIRNCAIDASNIGAQSSGLGMSIWQDAFNIVLDNVSIKALQGIDMFMLTHPETITLRNIQIKALAQTTPPNSAGAFGIIVSDTANAEAVLNIENVSIESGYYGINTNSGKIILNNISIKAQWCGLLGGGTMAVRNSSIEGSVISVQNMNSTDISINSSTVIGSLYGGYQSLTKIGSSKISGLQHPNPSGGTFKFVNCYDDNYEPIPNGSQTYQ